LLLPPRDEVGAARTLLTAAGIVVGTFGPATLKLEELRGSLTGG